MFYFCTLKDLHSQQRAYLLSVIGYYATLLHSFPPPYVGLPLIGSIHRQQEESSEYLGIVRVCLL
jgi:hypothetical protein